MNPLRKWNALKCRFIKNTANNGATADQAYSQEEISCEKIELIFGSENWLWKSNIQEFISETNMEKLFD